MSNEVNGDWNEDEVRNFIMDHLCNTENDKFDFAPLLMDLKSESPSSPKFLETLEQMEDGGYVTEAKPNYGHYWVKLRGPGKNKCEKVSEPNEN